VKCAPRNAALLFGLKVPARGEEKGKSRRAVTGNQSHNSKNTKENPFLPPKKKFSCLQRRRPKGSNGPVTACG
jgi:hypothetical protein